MEASKHRWQETHYNKRLDKFYYRCLDCPKAIVMYGDSARAIAQATLYKLEMTNDTGKGD